MKRQIAFRPPEELIERIDRHRGEQTRTDFVIEACDSRLRQREPAELAAVSGHAPPEPSPQDEIRIRQFTDRGWSRAAARSVVERTGPEAA